MATANDAIKISAMNACTAPKSTDLVLVLSANVANAAQWDTKHASITQFTSNFDKVIVTKASTPANNNATGLVLHQFWFDDNYMYVVVANNEIKRSPLQSF
jgi:hypothetical protein